jgi:hypothetical protein
MTMFDLAVDLLARIRDRLASTPIAGPVCIEPGCGRPANWPCTCDQVWCETHYSEALARQAS